MMKKKIILVLIYFSFSYLTIVCIKSYFFDIYEINNNMMKPTLSKGDHILINKFAYGYISNSQIPILKYFFNKIVLNDKPEKGDIIFYIDYNNRFRLSRVIGEPGDFIIMKKNRLSINNINIEYKQLEKHFVYCSKKRFNRLQYTEILSKDIKYKITNFVQNNFEIQVPKNQFFLSNDNRGCMLKKENQKSYLIDKERIIGKAQFFLYSININLNKLEKINLFKYYDFKKFLKSID